MKLCDVLEICPGVTAVIGSGGKTTLLQTLAGELSRRGTVLLCTTTKMWLPADVPVCHDANQVCSVLQEQNVVYAGTEDPVQGKLLPPVFQGWEKLADYVLVEADGAAGKPLKAHALWEPVLPEERTQTICVVGASGIGKTIVRSVHRPEIFAELCGASLRDAASLEKIGAVLKRENLTDRVFLNQMDTAPDHTAEALAEYLPWPLAAGSLHKEQWRSI